MLRSDSEALQTRADGVAGGLLFHCPGDWLRPANGRALGQHEWPSRLALSPSARPEVREVEKRLATFIAAAAVAASSLQAETETITLKSHPAHASRILVKRRTGAARQLIVQPLESMGIVIQEE